MEAKVTVTQAIRADRRLLRRLTRAATAPQSFGSRAHRTPEVELEAEIEAETREAHNLVLLHRRQEAGSEAFPDGGERAILALLS